jgi:hypothetical protein
MNFLSTYQPGNAACSSGRRYWRRLAAFTFISGALMTGAAHSQSASAWIELKPVAGRNMIQVTGHALALDAAGGMDFTLTMRRQNKGGSSSTRQSGRFDLAPNETKVLSSTSINLEPGDELTIELKLLDHGAEVSIATVTSKSAAAGQTL